MKRRILVLFTATALVIMAACGGSQKKDDTLEDSLKTEDKNTVNHQSKESDLSKEQSTGDIYDVDWDKCLDDLKESVLDSEFFPYAKDVYASVDEGKKQIIFTSIIDDSTEPSVALDYADTIIRQYNLIANMQDNSISLGGKDYYGGLYDQYNIMIGIAPLSKTENHEDWFIFDTVIAGTHKTIDLQEAYK